MPKVKLLAFHTQFPLFAPLPFLGSFRVTRLTTVHRAPAQALFSLLLKLPTGNLTALPTPNLPAGSCSPQPLRKMCLGNGIHWKPP